MFARVITARAGDDGFDGVIRLAQDQLPAARERPGFAGYFLLTDDDTGNVVIVSLWNTREDMQAVAGGTTAGVHQSGMPETGLHSVQLGTYEVAVEA